MHHVYWTCVLQIPGMKEDSALIESGRSVVAGVADNYGDSRGMEDLVRLLQIVEDVNSQDSVEKAVYTARRRRWFRTM